MNRFHPQLLLVIFTQLLFSLPAFAGPLDDYYLQQFGEEKSARLQKAVLSDSTDVQEAAKCGMPIKKALRRDWNLLETTTQKVLAKQLASPVLANPATYTSLAGHFKVHYATSAPNYPLDDRPPLTDSNSNGVPDWIETVAATFEAVYANYSSLGYHLAPTIAGAPYDIFLLDLAPQRYYGVTNSDQPISSASYPNAYSSWMELDNNFTDSIYKPALYSPLQSLQITAAHEYHHAIQYGYNYYFDIWYAEATSTWMEDELYDGVNQLYNYIPAWFTQSRLSLDTSESTTTGGGYGRWIFNRYLAEKHKTPDVILNVWKRLAGLNPKTEPINAWGDIKMTYVLDYVLSATYNSTLAEDFFGFAKRVYQRDWTDHIPDKIKIPDYSPVGTYLAYPVNGNVSSPTPSVTLPHYAFAYYAFLPSSSSSSDLSITVNGTSGIKATAFIKNSVGTITEYPFSTVNDTTVTIQGFSSSSEVVLLVANVTDVDNHVANFSTDGTLLAVTEPTPASQNDNNSSAGCFIATAAYGSYLHPQVKLLRHFRDNYLLTNAPGQAFVAFYYRCSPPLADFIAGRPFLRGVTRLLLTPVVIFVAHPAESGAALLLVVALLCRPLRRCCRERVVA